MFLATTYASSDMKITGNATLGAPVRTVWEALQDPALLARTVPGCTDLERPGPDTYRMTVAVEVAQVSGTYLAHVRVTERDFAHSFALWASGQGAPGTVDAAIAVQLSQVNEEVTRVDYEADASAGGTLGGVGQRVLVGAANRAAAEFFAAVDRELAGAPGAAPAEVPAAVAPARVGPAGSRAWAVAAAFGAGGVLALLGVVLGW